MPKLSRKETERRRLLAGRDLLGGMRQCDVAAKYSVDKGNISRWNKIVHSVGIEGLKTPDTKPGRKPKLSAKDRERLDQMIVEGAEAHGYENDVWTLPRITELIEHEFEVVHDPGLVWHILKDMGFSWHKPSSRSAQQDPGKVDEWLRVTWKRVEKNREWLDSSLPRRSGVHDDARDLEDLGTSRADTDHPSPCVEMDLDAMHLRPDHRRSALLQDTN